RPNHPESIVSRGIAKSILEDHVPAESGIGADEADAVSGAHSIDRLSNIIPGLRLACRLLFSNPEGQEQQRRRGESNRSWDLRLDSEKAGKRDCRAASERHCLIAPALRLDEIGT